MTFNESNTVEAFIRDRLKSIGWEFIDHICATPSSA